MPYIGAEIMIYEEEIEHEIKGNMWLDLWIAADECIKKSGKEKFQYIEEFIQKENKLCLYTGS